MYTRPINFNRQFVHIRQRIRKYLTKLPDVEHTRAYLFCGGQYDEWMFCMSVMYERLSSAQVRVELCIKCFGEKDILREHFWSPRNNDVIIFDKFFKNFVFHFVVFLTSLLVFLSLHYLSKLTITPAHSSSTYYIYQYIKPNSILHIPI
jgi:hypothetical protein